MSSKHFRGQLLILTFTFLWIICGTAYAEMKLYDSIDKRAIEKIESQKKSIKEGSREWEILYRKYYNEEISKLGKFFD